jgi:hypothetical protein
VVHPNYVPPDPFEKLTLEDGEGWSIGQVTVYRFYEDIDCFAFAYIAVSKYLALISAIIDVVELDPTVVFEEVT